MRSTTTFIAPFAVATLLVGAAPAMASAAPAAHSQHVVVTATARVLELTPNGTAVVTGMVNGSLGKGAMVSRRKADGSQDEKSKGTLYFAKGSVRGTSVLEMKRVGDHVRITGSLKVTSGTGRFAGAHGRLKVRGSGDRTAQLITITMKGNFRY